MQCCSVLAARGFELDVKPPSSAKTKKTKGRAGKSADGRKEVSTSDSPSK
jgi:hypothetical protein